jgi:serine/threonine protein kinase
VTCDNILLNRQLKTKLSDFEGLLLDKSLFLVIVTASYRCPKPAISIQEDIFALGSILYKIIIGYVPYYNFPKEEVKA